jgi:hypothetical protein
MRARILAIALVILTGLSLPALPLHSVEPQPEFRFQDNFWVNLHHFVRAEARRRAFKVPPVMPDASLSETERAAWSWALDIYAELAKLDLVFDERLIRINKALAVQGEAATLPDGVIEPRFLEALNRAAPIYRAHLWPEHRRLNEEWIARIRPLVDQHAPALSHALADAFHAPWSKKPILVDASFEAGPVGGYTTEGPPGFAAHSVIAPGKTSETDMAFEIVFHEASHSVDEQIMKHVDEEAARQKVKPHPDLWHALLFYTSGELVKRELHKEKDATYKPYAYRFGVYDRRWQTLRAGLEKDWQPYLDGKVGFDQALAKLVADCPGIKEGLGEREKRKKEGISTSRLIPQSSGPTSSPRTAGSPP